MIAILIKELRANAQWAALGFVGVALAFVALAYGANERAGLPSTIFVPAVAPVLISDWMNIVTGLGFPAIGFFLGMLVVLEDHGIGNWSFLTHRPISRARIFSGKAAAAMLLYAAATALPLAAIAIWTAIPGDVAAPFDWHMILPRLANELAGAGWIAAGLLVAARRARWLGSRLFPAALILAACFGAELTNQHDLTVWLTLSAAPVIVGIAAYAAFVTHGEFARQWWIGRFIETAGVMGAIAILLVAFAVIVYALCQSTSGSQPDYSRYFLNAQGKFFRIESQAGRVVKTYQWNGGRFVAAANETGEPAPRTLVPIGRDNDLAPDRSLFSSRRFAIPAFPEHNPQWYWVPGRRRFEAFSMNSRLWTASLGANGVVPASGSAAPLAEDLSLTCQPVDFDRSTVWWIVPPQPPRRLYKVPAGQTIRIVADLAPVRSPQQPLSGPPDLLAVFTQSEVRLLQSGRVRWHAALVAGGKWTAYTIAPTAAGGFAAFVQPRNVLITIGPDGREESSVTFAALPENTDEAPSAERSLVVGLAPPLKVWWSAMRGDWPFGGAALLASGALSVIWAAAGWLLMRQRDRSTFDRWWWTVLCGSAGVGGVLTLLCMRTPTAQVKCAACGKRRFVAKERCRHCGAPFPPPANTGIEIFEPRHAVEVAR